MLTNGNTFILITLFFLSLNSNLSAQEIQLDNGENSIRGVGEAITGNTIKIDNFKIVLEYTQAPKLEQICIDKQIGRYNCGDASRNYLQEYISNKLLYCEFKRWNDSGERVSQCFTDDNLDLSKIIITSGWSIVKWFDRNTNKEPEKCSFTYCESISEDYWLLEQQAVKNQRGLWSSKFDFPWLY